MWACIWSCLGEIPWWACIVLFFAGVLFALLTIATMGGTIFGLPTWVAAAIAGLGGAVSGGLLTCLNQCGRR
jgi:hypothetical protein